MKIFTNIPTNCNYDTIEQAVRAIKHRERELRDQKLLNVPWSVVELQPDNEDFTWLINWMRQLSFGVAQRCLEDGQWRTFAINASPCSYTTGIGILLLISAVEVARRETDERSLWRVISQSHFSASVRKLLFVQGNPTRVYKDAIELAARWLDLRHVFGIQGLQSWYDTVYLQLGFSQQGFMRRLPEWLVGWGQTQSIQQLSQGRIRSESFNRLWEKLQHFRHRYITENQLRVALRESPWILPEWADDLVKLAVKPVSGGGSENVPGRSYEEDIVPFLGAPTLHWDISHQPRFVCSVANLALMDLQDNTYNIVIAGQDCVHLQKQTDGSYRAWPSDEIELSTSAPQLTANLIAADGQVERSQMLQLWNENEDVNAFHKRSGQRFDPWNTVINPNHEVFLLLTDDLILEPPAPYWHVFPQHHIKLYYLPSGWSALTRVLLGNQVLWLPCSRTSPTPRSAEELASQIRIFPYKENQPASQIFFGDRIQFRITLPIDCRLVFLRACGQPIVFQQSNFTANSVITKKISITPHSFNFETLCQIELLLGIKTSADDTNITRIRHVANLPISGAARLTEDGWVALHPTEGLELEQARRQPLKFFLLDIDKWDVLEGDIWIQHLSHKPRPLTTLGGYGASLKLCKGAYNHYDQPRVLSSEVVDHGSLVNVECDAPGVPMRTLHLQLSHPIELDEHYMLSWWDQDGTFHTFIPEQDTTTWWRAEVPPGLTEPIAIAITYKGRCLGSWWNTEWSATLQQPTQQKPQTIAALVRWFHLPVLSQHYQDDVRLFAFAYPGETLIAWIANTDNGLPPMLQPGELDDGWLSAVRTIFWSWQPTTASVRQIMTQLVPDTTNQSAPDILQSIAWRLLRVSPLLMGLLIKQWVNGEGIPSWGAPSAKALVQQLLYGIAAVENSDGELREKIALLETKVAEEMKIDPSFLHKSLIRRACDLLSNSASELERLDQENIAAAMNTEPFRRLLGIRLLESIVQRIK